jgi:hypothetical protein
MLRAFSTKVGTSFSGGLVPSRSITQPVPILSQTIAATAGSGGELSTFANGRRYLGLQAKHHALEQVYVFR